MKDREKAPVSKGVKAAAATMIAVACAVVLGVGVFIGVTCAKDAAKKETPGTSEDQAATAPATDENTAGVFASVEAMEKAVSGLYWGADPDGGSVTILFLSGGEFYSDLFHDRDLTAEKAEERILADLGKDPAGATLDDFYRITNRCDYQSGAIYEPETGRIYLSEAGSLRFYYECSDGRLTYWAWDDEARETLRTDFVFQKL